MTIELNEQELLEQISGDSPKQIKSKELFEYLLKQGKCYDFYRYLIWALDYEDTLNDYICEYMDINNCFPEED
jgi:hypothetical protein